MRRLPMMVFALWAVCGTDGARIARADELLFRYDCDIVPNDPASGLDVFQECTPAQTCSDFVQDGHYVIEWGAMGDIVNYRGPISTPGEEPPPTLWTEWRYRSNLPIQPGEVGCDGAAQVQFRGIVDLVDLHGNGAVSFDGGSSVVGLPVDNFYTLRFESFDGENYTFAIDGRVFFTDFDGKPGSGFSSIQFGGSGTCDRPFPGFISRNEWDFVRYGTLSVGEAVLASDPPSGFLDPDQYPSLDRFTVTFDHPGFVYVDDVTVTVTGLGSPPAPQVLWVKRPDNSEPDMVEILLDQAIPLNATTTFTLSTGGTPNTVSYSYAVQGACCAVGKCEDSDSAACAAAGGFFTEGASCTAPASCCTGGTCSEVDPLCCTAMRGMANAESRMASEEPAHRQITTSPNHYIAKSPNGHRRRCLRR